jgi:DNA-nicking Smr family endonuclease
VRSLSADEKALWARVAATIRPLSREPNPPRDGEGGRSANLSGGGGSVQDSKPPPPPSALPLPVPGRSLHLRNATLDSSWDRRLASGSVQPDRVVDLHGLTLDQAWSAIDRGLERAVETGDRLVLLITGHARPGDPPVERGKIRAAVHDWLAASRHASNIAAIRGAHRRHGGGGSLYIILRRNRSRSTFS